MKNNFTISLILHLGFAVGIFVLSLSAPAQRVIAPDRIQIIQLDLRNVRVRGDETRLVNREERRQTAPSPRPAPPQPTTPTPQPVVAQPEQSEQPAQPREPELQTIRVNREVHSVDRTLTVSVIDALRIAMTRCWSIDTSRPGLEGMRAVVHIRLFPSGRVQDIRFEQASLADEDPVWAYVFETIRDAIDACDPFSMLPYNEYENWRNIRMAFFPSNRVIE